MVDWHNYWNAAPKHIDKHDFLKQVGRTVNGTAISEDSVNIIVQNIVSKLEITDHVLDLCCGNGFITAKLAPYCSHITGIDFCKPLIRIANLHFKRQNITYEVADVRQLPDRVRKKIFTKILMNFSVQYFTVYDLSELLENIQRSALRYCPILFSSIPDKSHLWDFYNTRARRADYYRRIQDGTEAIGTWYQQSEFAELASSCGYKAEFFRQNADLDTAHYSFDAMLSLKVEV